ncbi:NACHT, LRR and PYD domains-containing protein 3-like [Porphyrio hochstetteri]
MSCMVQNDREDAVMDTAIGLFEEMQQRDLTKKLLDEVVKEYKQKYREHVVRKFLWYIDMSSCLGENLSFSSHYTNLTIARRPRSERQGEHEAVGSSCGHADVGNGLATVTVPVQSLFEPEDSEQVLQVVVLVGALAMGKTLMIRKVMVEWV